MCTVYRAVSASKLYLKRSVLWTDKSFNGLMISHRHMMHVTMVCGLHGWIGQYEHFVTQVSSIIYLSVLLCVGWFGLTVIHSIRLSQGLLSDWVNEGFGCLSASNYLKVNSSLLLLTGNVSFNHYKSFWFLDYFATCRRSQPVDCSVY